MLLFEDLLAVFITFPLKPCQQIICKLSDDSGHSFDNIISAILSLCSQDAFLIIMDKSSIAFD